ncbi:MAG: hypothetical protein ACU0GG_15835 [Paracoccaceae bacterium]
MSAIRHLVTVGVLCAVLTGCQDGETDTTETDASIPSALAPQRAACERDGGRWGGVPNRDTFTCYRTTRDANKRCDSARDCEGLCLARSRTCAPQTPLFGCHDVFSADGLRQTLCIE